MDTLTFYVTAMVFIEIFADFQLRFYATTEKLIHLLAGILGYTGVLYYFIQALRLDTVLYVNALWDGISHISESMFAYFVMGERLRNTPQYIGLVMVVVGTFIMRRYRE
jgi:multidrug transporter EmrE-like cation transporter